MRSTRADHVCSPPAIPRATSSRCCTRQGILIEAKPFALGVRIEHPQAVIDRIRYHSEGA
jgi:uncharacterized FAD-dependent dehydrogenase